MLSVSERAETARRAKRAYKARRSAGWVLGEPVPKLATVYERDNGVCYLCGERTTPPLGKATDPRDPKRPTIDHLVALSRGGKDTYANVKLACMLCNRRKSNR